MGHRPGRYLDSLIRPIGLSSPLRPLDLAIAPSQLGVTTPPRPKGLTSPLKPLGLIIPPNQQV